MNKEQRKKVTQDQVSKFFASYFANWRLQQVLTIEKLFKNKFEFYSSIIADTKQPDDPNGDSTISQEITNGLMFETISICIQYVEDLFALLKAGENRDFFIKNIITYDAGRVENFIKKDFNEEQLCKLFYFPNCKEGFEELQIQETYSDCIAQLIKWMEEFRAFHFKYKFYYIQYKHGLTVALRPYGRMGDEQIKKSKAGDYNHYLAAFDNINVDKLKGQKNRIDGSIMMPCFTENVVPHIAELTKEDNLVRYALQPSETTFENLKGIAYKVRDCINVFKDNIQSAIFEDKPLKLCLPSSETGLVIQFSFPDLTI